MGRPTKYNKKIAEKICSLIATDTYTVAEVCRMVKINPDTYYTWVKEYSEFSESIKKAEAERTAFFVAEAKKSLLKKIQGYTVQEKHVITVGSGKFDVNGREIPRIKEQKVVDKHYQPDTAAIIFTLTNGEPENWKNRQNNEVTGKDGKDLFAQLTDEELDAKISDLEKKLGK
ncbi:transposase [uncultured Alistipes sp.]|uniref:transposase n=1 Tax=uncultured Alistipes sp. TaxID=538949 RepID=UPI0026282E60|nr:transposase [uncultured Alistipes sp.]